jgi:hypothetical protein
MYTQRSKIFDTLLVTDILKYYADKRLSDEFMIYFSKRTRQLRLTYGWGLYRQCVFKNYVTIESNYDEKFNIKKINPSRFIDYWYYYELGDWHWDGDIYTCTQYCTYVKDKWYLHIYKYKCYEDSDDDDVDDIVISIENPQFTKIKQRLETKYKIKFPSIEEIKNSKKDHTEIQLN